MKDLRKRLVPAVVGIVVAILLLQWSWGFALLLIIAMVGCGREAFNLNAALVKEKGQKIGLAVIHFGIFSWTLYHLFAQIWPEHLPNSGRQEIYSVACLTYAVLAYLALSSKFKINPLAYSWLYPWLGFFATIEICFQDSDYSISYFLLLLISIWMSDAGAYFVGNIYGQNKLAPTISPNKTLEGFYGALLGVGIATVIGGYILSFSLVFGILWAVTIWLSSVAGDLFESKLKRMVGVKDSGEFLPGHGGYLDRFDSLIFSAPFVYFLIQTA